MVAVIIAGRLVRAATGAATVEVLVRVQSSSSSNNSRKTSNGSNRSGNSRSPSKGTK